MWTYNDVLAFAEGDSRVAGVVLGGSRGKGLATERSDWDVCIVVGDDASPADVAICLKGARTEVDVCAVMTVAEFEAHAGVGDLQEWNRYTFAHVTPVLDRTGELQRLCDEKEWLPEDVARSRATSMLDAYINSHYRALKNARDGDQPASRLDAAEATTHLLDFVFTAERRVRPFNKFLSWELATHPLDHAWWGDPDPVQQLLQLSDGDLDAALREFAVVEREAGSMGYDEVLASWEPSSLALMRSGT